MMGADGTSGGFILLLSGSGSPLNSANFINQGSISGDTGILINNASEVGPNIIPI